MEEFKKKFKNEFDLLGIEPTTNREKIKKAFRKEAKKYHPDKNDGSDDKIDKYEAIVNAKGEILEGLNKMEEEMKDLIIVENKNEKFEEADIEATSGTYLGIDLGTTNSVVSYVEDIGKVKTLKVIPSAIFFMNEGNYIFGNKALKKGRIYPESLVTNFKRKLINRKETFTVKYKDTGEEIKITGEEASSIFLKYLREEAISKLGNVTNTVITIPANFNNAEIESTKKAGEKAGFNKVKLEKEPTAAAIAYSLDEDKDNTILVYDFGGGTFDLSLLKSTVSSDGSKVLEVIDTNGDSKLGGEDFTNKIMELIKEKLEEEFELDMESLDKSGLNETDFLLNNREIRDSAEEIKLELSKLEESDISFDPIVNKNKDTKPFKFSMTRKQYERLIKDDVRRTIDILDSLLKKVSIDITEIDELVLAGGTSLTPLIKNELKNFIEKEPNFEKDSSKVISVGAAIIADLEWNKDKERGIQSEIKIINTTVHDFGVSIQGRTFDCLIDAGSSLPKKVDKIYSLVKDNQDELKISIFRRDNFYKSKKVFDNGIEFVDDILITNLPPMSKNDAKIEVSFELSKEDILSVEVNVKDAYGSMVKSDGLKIEKSSREILN